MKTKPQQTDIVSEARELLAKFTPYKKLYSHYLPSQGLAVCWKNQDGHMIPVCHMRWTDGLRPEIETRLENECKLFAAAPELLRQLADECERLREQWNTRFNTLCGLCGKRYLGPRDEHLHGYGRCDKKVNNDD